MKPRNYVCLADYATFKVGGAARHFIEVHSVSELEEAVRFAGENGLPFFILGAGSNVLFPDAGLHGLVAKISLKGRRWSDGEAGTTLVSASAGEVWDDLVRESAERGLYGLENLSGIPGTVGAAPIQNIGAYGAEIKDALVSAEVFNVKTGELERLSREACAFSYRHRHRRKVRGILACCIIYVDRNHVIVCLA
jgi:UDP-N-acetylmuramate dehydrogenase